MKLFFALIILPCRLLSQDLSGVWTGYLQANGVNLPYEIAIGNDLSGYSLTVFNIDGYENVGIKAIKLKEKQGNILIEDNKLIYNNYISTSRRIKLLGQMMLMVRDSVMTLKGVFRTRSLDFRGPSGGTFSGSITLTKLMVAQETKLIGTLKELNLLNTLRLQHNKHSIKAQNNNVPATAVEPAGNEKPDSITAAAELATRQTEVIQQVFFKSDSLVLKLYDHGVIDGDTVSVVLNGKVIVARKRLTGKPIVSVLHITPDLGDSLLLVMYAESLGTIPPNTGILIVQDGDKRYEIRFEGTRQKSSAILLTRQKR